MRRFLQHIKEAWFDTRRSSLKRGKETFEIFKNPSIHEVKKELTYLNGLRALVKGKDILVWDIYAEFHSTLRKVYGWNDSIAIIINAYPKRWVGLSEEYSYGMPVEEVRKLQAQVEANANIKRAIGGDFKVYQHDKEPIP